MAEKPSGFLPSPTAHRVSVRKVKTADALYRIFFDSGFDAFCIRVNRAANGGSHTPRTIASTPCYCGESEPLRPCWLV